MWPDWLSPQNLLNEQLNEFLTLYNNRPVLDNQGGVKSVGAFSLWFFLKTLKPKLVVESGVWKGQTTWLIEQTLPDAQIICLDPNRKVREYTSSRAEYPDQDFATLSLDSWNPDEVVVFFDDHQDAFKRLIQARKKGLVHLIYDDNYPPGCGGHKTIQHSFHESTRTQKYLEQILEAYRVFPPLFSYSEPITMEKVIIDVPSLELPEQSLPAPFRQDADTYRWMTYVQLKKSVPFSLGRYLLELMS